jgi:hypothetical protein
VEGHGEQAGAATVCGDGDYYFGGEFGGAGAGFVISAACANSQLAAETFYGRATSTVVPHFAIWIRNMSLRHDFAKSRGDRL